MRFYNIQPKEESYPRSDYQWHKWFAWYPVSNPDKIIVPPYGHGSIRYEEAAITFWLETVWRKRSNYEPNEWYYKPIEEGVI